MLTTEDQEPWRSGPLTFRVASQVWASAAGINGAFVPAAFGAVASEWAPDDRVVRRSGMRPWCHADVGEFLTAILEESDRRANYRQESIAGGQVAIARATVEYGRLVWRTSVDVVLYHLETGSFDGATWEVAIERGAHVSRQDAAERAMRNANVLTLTYDCRSCGACCVGDLDDGGGYATVSADDVVRMSRHARRRLHRARVGGEVYLSTPSIVTDEFGKSCAFLRGTPGRRCSCGIYESRPDVCRRYLPGGRGCVTARIDLGLWSGR